MAKQGIALLVDKVAKLKSLTKAILLGSRLPPERIEKRLEVCFDCDHVLVLQVANTNSPERQKVACGICQCRLSGNRELLNLAAYEETNDYGCHHPKGSQWKKNGV